MTRKIVTVLMLVGVVAWTSQALAFPTHDGNADPETEGWTRQANGNMNDVGVFVGDVGTNPPAWGHVKTATFGGSSNFYASVPSPPEIAGFAANGYILKVIGRHPGLDESGSDDTPDAGVVVSLSMAAIGSVQLNIGMQDGTVLARVVGDGEGTFAVPGSSDQTWHTYRLTYDAGTGMVQLSADGTNLGDPFAPAGTGSDNLYWMNGSSSAQGAFYWNHLSLTEIPEPATLCLFGLGGLALLRRRR